MSPTETNAMEDACMQLHDFVAGELSGDAADAFRIHLGSCESCPGELGELLQLAALEDAAAVAIAAPEDVASEAGPRDELAARRRKRIAVFAVAGALAAAAAVFLIVRRGPTESRAPVELALATAPQRPLELRVSAADDYRPYEVMRSGELPAEKIPFSVLAKLQEAGAVQRLANAHLLMREPDKAEALLAEIEPTASVLADRGVAASLRGDNHAALRYFAESLEKEPENPRVLWNQAIVYRDLDLPLGAAKLFDQVAKLGEPGWSEEAAKNAAALRGAKEATEAYKKAYTQGSGEIAEGKVLALDIVSRYPGLGRLLFYDAVRSAGSPEALAALSPHAKALDAHYGTDDCSRFIARIGIPDWKKRAPLAAKYREMIAAGEDAVLAGTIIRPARAAGADDIALGALVLSAPSDELVGELRTMAAATGDDWFALLAENRAGDLLLTQGRVEEARAVLDAALESCRREPIAYRCSRVASSAVRARAALFEILEARKAAQMGLDWAASVDDIYALASTRFLLAQTELNSDEVSATAAALVRAYLAENLLLEENRCSRAYAFLLLTDLSSRVEDWPRAAESDRRFTEERAACGNWPLEPGIAYIRAVVLARARPGDELEAFRAEVEALRSGASALTTAGFDLAEGVAILPSNPEEGRRLLAQAIEKADAAPIDAVSEQFRAWAFMHLVMDASRRDAHREVLDLLAREVGVAPPTRCAVGLAYHQGLAAAAVGPDGDLAGRADPDYALEAPPIPDSFRERLRGCGEVHVIARTPFFGRASLLPDDIAWSFVTGGRAKGTQTVPRKRVIIADVNPPESLGLPLLGRYAGGTEDGLLLAGGAATPERVLAELERATEVEIHAHGLLATATGSGFIALSPSSSGEFRLTAEKISRVELHGRPTVILGACNAGRTAAYLHETWGLPIALRRAGAQTIFASPNPIPDSSSSAFFAALRQKLGSGLSPAVALRDVRLAWRSRSPDSSQWAAEILVFE